MPGSAGEHQGIGTALGDVARTALHQAQVHHPLGDGFRRRQMGIAVGIARPELVHGRLETAQVQLIDLFLTGRETFAHRHGGRKVAAVVLGILGAGIQQEDVPLPERMDEAVIVQDLARHRRDGGERQAAAGTGRRDLEHRGGDFGLVHARAGQPIGFQVHPRTHVHRLLDDGDLLGRLVDAQVHDGPDQDLVGMQGLHTRQDAQQVHQAHLVVGPVRGQEPDFPALAHGLAQILLER